MAYRSNRLPSRFPIGTKLVIEGPRGVEGQRGDQVEIYSRYLEFPDGTLLALPSRAAPPKPGQARRNRRTRTRRH
jgi:hypothetical protein